ncbi:hypothetical protein ABT369_53870 [Dactylosporangium sp. NPDC000244]|uniref:hypothetical protein n=1 Tax=Dactylosporangium sp. NPDC000244 TaxID=3154365 RepID=UPI00331D65EE
MLRNDLGSFGAKLSDVVAGSWFVQVTRLRSANEHFRQEGVHPNPAGWDALSVFIQPQFLGV